MFWTPKQQIYPTYPADLENLTNNEQTVFLRLKNQAIRLEQECIGFNTLTGMLNAFCTDKFLTINQDVVIAAGIAAIQKPGMANT